MIKNDEGIPSKNQKKLASFAEYCLKYPDQRFWQALRNWSKVPFILIATDIDFSKDKVAYKGIKDTFHIE